LALLPSTSYHVLPSSVCDFPVFICIDYGLTALVYVGGEFLWSMYDGIAIVAIVAIVAMYVFHGREK
jgi:hypothetical protein